MSAQVFSPENSKGTLSGSPSDVPVARRFPVATFLLLIRRSSRCSRRVHHSTRPVAIVVVFVVMVTVQSMQMMQRVGRETPFENFAPDSLVVFDGADGSTGRAARRCHHLNGRVDDRRRRRWEENLRQMLDATYGSRGSRSRRIGMRLDYVHERTAHVGMNLARRCGQAVDGRYLRGPRRRSPY